MDSSLQERRIIWLQEGVYSRKVDKTTGLKYDQSVKLTGFYIKKDYPDYLRRIKYRDEETGKIYVFLTNNFELSALLIAQLYKERWKIELFSNG